MNDMLMDLTNLESRHIFVGSKETNVAVSQVVETVDSILSKDEATYRRST